MATATYNMTDASFPAAVDGLTASNITQSGSLSVFQQGNRNGNLVLQASCASTTAAAARTNGHYVTFTITGTNLKITSISLGAMRGGTSTARGFALATSDDSFATFLLQDDSIDTVAPTLTTYTASGLEIALNGSVEIRIYPYMGINTQTSEFDNIVVTAEAAGGTTHATTGALTGQGSSVAGTAAHVAVHATSGALTGPGTSLAGSAARLRAFATSGALTGQGSTVAGTAARSDGSVTHATSGSLTGQGSTVAGTSARLRAFATSGALTGPGATLAGVSALLRTHATTGVLAGQGAVIAGTAARVGGDHMTTGALTGQGSQVSGGALSGTVTAGALGRMVSAFAS